MNDQTQPVVGVAGLTLAGLLAVVGLLLRHRAERFEGTESYPGTADHRFGHPLHWILVVVRLLLGHALGIGATTPRFRLQSPIRKS